MDNKKSKENIIVIDWGTTNVRAFLLNAQSGEIIAQRRSDKGIKFVPRDGYPVVYQELTSDWRESSNFTLMAGMVGSANGWEEAAYVSLPASPAKVGEHIYKLSAMENVYIVGGLCCHKKDDTYDVIRGEEVQIIGLTSKLKQEGHLVCLPGTHSKWLEIDENNIIDSFTTVMSGDFFSAICTSTIMAMMLESPQEFSKDHFRKGIEISATPGGLMAHMFKVRGALLFKQIEAKHVESMISGIVIGSEIHNMRTLYNTKSQVHVIGSDALGEKYSLALDILEIEHQLHSSDEMSLAGMRVLACNIGSSSLIGN